MFRNVSRIFPGFALTILVAGASGCWGPSQFDVTGQVKYNGSPVRKPGGQIVFVRPDGSQVAASIEEDGAYRASNVTAGLNQIAVYYPSPGAQGGKRFPPSQKKGEAQPAAASSAPQPFLTPKKYASVDTSDLTVQVEEGTVFNANLTGPPIR
jgi:hypothetical protein